MMPYWAVLSARFRLLLQYRGAAIAGLGTQLFWGLIRVMIFEAFYRSSNAIQPMDYSQVVTYIWLGQAMFAMLLLLIDNDIRAMIKNGSVVYELVRPVDLYTLWFSRAVAMKVAPTVLRAVPLFIISGLFFGLKSPPSVQSAVAWALATIGAVLLGAAISNLMVISLLWTISGEGLARLMPTILIVFSGMVLPLPLFPDWAQRLLGFLPFGYLADVPFRLYIGHIAPENIGAVLLHQALWIAVLVVLGRYLLARGTRRLVVQGG